jgi:hypothetical protein
MSQNSPGQEIFFCDYFLLLKIAQLELRGLFTPPGHLPEFYQQVTGHAGLICWHFGMSAKIVKNGTFLTITTNSGVVVCEVEIPLQVFLPQLPPLPSSSSPFGLIV